MLTFHIYCLITVISTAYFLHSIFSKENQLFVFTIYVLKSKLHFCLLINCVIMLMMVTGKILIKIFFDETRLSEMMQVVDKIRMKFFTFLLLFLAFRPSIDISKILVVVVYHFMCILTLLGFRRSSYIISINEKSKKVQLKIVLIYIFLAGVNYLLYILITVPVDQLISAPGKQKTTNGSTNIVLDSLIYYIFSCEFLFLLLKLAMKFVKLILDITAINLQKTWDLRLIVFNAISLVRYSVKLYIELKFCLILFKVGVIPIFFIFDVIYSFWHLIKLGNRLYENYKTDKYINNLSDYVAPPEEENAELSEEELKKKRNENSTICNVCLGEIKHGKILYCGHIFHLRCIKGWVTGNSNCPICKEPVVSDFKRARFYTQQLGMQQNNLPIDHPEPEEKAKSNENITSSTISPHTNGSSSSGYSLQNNPELTRYLFYKRMIKFTELLDKNAGKFIETGGISYSFPCQALYNRTFHGEVRRIEIETLNKNIIELYDTPLNAMSKYEEEINSLKNEKIHPRILNEI